MKHLITIISCFVVLSMGAQTDYPFPWNPDADLDGWVSTEDLLLLLTVFGTQFEPDTWETDSISAAVVLDGNHNYFQCQSYCNDIEGNWRMADLDAFGRHFDLANSVSAYFWVNGNDKLNSSDFAYDTYQLYGPTGDMANVSVSNFSQAKKCMCYIQSSPFVPSQYTEDSNLALWGSVSDLQGQVDSLQTALDSLQTSSATVDSSATVSSPYTLECVDMGLSILCPPGVGWADYVTLGPNADGFTYNISSTQELDDNNLVTGPLWRKFRLGGIDSSDESISIGFLYEYNGYGDPSYNHEQIEAVNEDGEYYFYLYEMRYGCGGLSAYNYQPCCEEEGIPLTIPMEYAFGVGGFNITGGGYSVDHIEILILEDGFYRNTGLYIDVQ